MSLGPVPMDWESTLNTPIVMFMHIFVRERSAKTSIGAGKLEGRHALHQPPIAFIAQHKGTMAIAIRTSENQRTQ
jgi:hypothetical protein